MSMKKKTLFLLIPLLIAGLTGCVKYNGQGKPGTNKGKSEISSSSQKEEESSEWPIQPSTPPAPHGAGESEPEVPPATNVTVYLVFGENGLYNGNKVTTNNDQLFLEHVVEFTALSGSDLPGKDKVTSSVEGSSFVAWTAYNNDGKITEYTKVPSVDKKILYASFTGGKGGEQSSSGSSEQQSSDTPQPNPGFPTEGYGLVFVDGTFMKAEYTDKFGEYEQYVISDGSFKQGQSFSLYHFGPNDSWVVPIDPYSFNEQPDQYLGYDEVGKKYHVLKDFTADVYIKMKMNADQIYFGLKA